MCRSLGESQTPAFSCESASFMNCGGGEQEINKKQALPASLCHVWPLGENQTPVPSSVPTSALTISCQLIWKNTSCDDSY